MSLAKMKREKDNRELGLRRKKWRRRRHFDYCIHYSMFILVIFVQIIHCNTAMTRTNMPPRFKSDGNDFDSQSEIVVRVKEGSSSLNKEIYHLYGEDPDNDPLSFGVLGTIGKDLLRIESISSTEAKIYLKKELDREIQDSYTLVLTITDGKLGKGNYVSYCKKVGKDLNLF